MNSRKIDEMEGQLVESPRNRAKLGLAGLVAAGALALGLTLGGAGIAPASADTDAVDASATAAATATSESSSLAETVAAKVLPSVGSVYALVQTSSTQGVSQGSCEVISSDGYIVTNYHVVANAAKVQVILNDTSYDAEIVGSDPSSDVAVLKVDPGDNTLTPIEMGDSSQLQVGQWVMTVGSPYGESGSVSTGIVSGLNRTASIQLRDDTEAYYVGAIQADAMINSGSSGGAMVNEDGQFIGMTTYATTSTGDWTGMTYAIPSNYVQNVANQIINNGTVEHPQLGVSVADLVDAYYQGYYNMQSSSSVTGAYVTRVVDGSGAANAGVQAGDVITALNGNAVSSADDLVIQIRSNNIGDTVTLTIERDGEEQDLQVTLGSDADTSSSSSSSSSSSDDQQGGWGGNGWGGNGWGWSNGSNNSGDSDASGDSGSSDGTSDASDGGSDNSGWSWGGGWGSGNSGSDNSDNSDNGGSGWGWGNGSDNSGWGWGNGGSRGNGGNGWGFWGTSGQSSIDQQSA